MKILTDLIDSLHCGLGIGTPPPEMVRMAALLWLSSFAAGVAVIYLLLDYVI